MTDRTDFNVTYSAYERPHEMSNDCWCKPIVEKVSPRHRSKKAATPSIKESPTLNTRGDAP